MATRPVAAALSALVLAACVGCSSGDPTGSPGPSTVAFPEVHLEVTVPAGLSDLTYFVGASEEGQPALYFSTKKMASVGGPSCAAGAQAAVSPYPLGQIVVSEETPQHVRNEARENPDDALGRFVKRVGEQYLYYLPPPRESCVSNPKAATLQRSLTVELRPALSTLRSTS
jgi:hypothetical protein